MNQELISLLRTNALDNFPQHKDLCTQDIGVSVFHDVQYQITYFLLFDAKGYITYCTSEEHLQECLREKHLRRVLNAPEHPFKSRRASVQPLSYEDLF